MEEIKQSIERAEKSLASIKLAPGPQHQAIIELIVIAKGLVSIVEGLTPAPAPVPTQSA